jgi:predicted nucleotide-binding protein
MGSSEQIGSIMADESQLRPRVFIGSSREGHAIAEAIQLNLDHACEVTIWSQGVFGLGEGTLESLVEKLDSFDFAILVLTNDDVTISREEMKQSPRDNVLL